MRFSLGIHMSCRHDALLHAAQAAFVLARTVVPGDEARINFDTQLLHVPVQVAIGQAIWLC
jgi:hypothetical protein